jgi:exonuclease VII small subunit
MMDKEAFLSARRRGDALHALEGEIVQEKASALGRAGLRLEEALEALEKVVDSIGETERRLQRREGSAEEAGQLREAHSRLMVDIDVFRQRVNLAHQYLIIQREAVGVRNHADVERYYGIAGRLR